MVKFTKEKGWGLVHGCGGARAAAHGGRSRGRYPHLFTEAEIWRSLWKVFPRHSKRDDPFQRTAKAKIRLLYSALWLCLVLLVGYNLVRLAMLCVYI